MPQRPVALSGFMGAGKSTLGARIARSRGLGFVDLDEELEAAFGRPVAAVFAEEGEDAFRAMEARLLRQALALPDRVVALGGGAVLDPASRALLKARATWVHLDVPLHELERRVSLQGEGTRPLWGDRAEVTRRFEERAPLYAEAPHRLDAEGRPGDVALRLSQLLDSVDAPVDPPAPRSPERVVVPLDPSYEVVIGRAMAGLDQAIGAIGHGPIAVLSDWNVGPLHQDAVLDRLGGTGRPLVSLTLPAGEENKQLAPVTDAVARLLDRGWQRGAPVVALGGGVLGDMAGLVAALLLRGVPFVQVPTTLLAMVDSAVGGKVGVNHRRKKNLIGQFHQPALVWADLSWLDTLPDRELRAGLAEVVKTALLGDEVLLERLEREPEAYLARDPDALADAVARCVRFKAEVVAEDEREAGRRAILNLGHTLGHAIEAAASPEQVRHGEAVAIGLVAAAELSVREVGADQGLPNRIRDVLTGLGLPIRAPRLPRAALLSAMRGDKKLKDGAVTWILMETTGRPRLVSCPVADLDARLDVLVDAGVLTEPGD